jgi:hypothetical protein
MTDNTVLSAGSGGDTIRDVAKTATGAKTQVMLVDGGGGSNTLQLYRRAASPPKTLSIKP